MIAQIKGKITIGEKILRLRKGLDLTQSQLADKIGVSWVTVCRLEKDKFDPRLSTLRKLAEVFGVTLDELAGE